MTLTYKLELDILPLDLQSKIQVRTSVCLAVTEVKHTHTDGHTDDIKTITPITSETWGGKSVKTC